MKKLAVIFVFIFLCTALCGCTDKIFPYKNQQFADRPSVEYTVYVCGAVQNEGYVTVPSGSDYFYAINIAGLIDASVLPSYTNSFVDADVTQITVGYFYQGVRYDCINVNGPLVANRMKIDGVDSAVVNKIADYLSVYGKITDKTLLADILGEDYRDNYYRFFVAREDYEKVN